jgi:hypothetical protein
LVYSELKSVKHKKIQSHLGGGTNGRLYID